MSSLDFALKDLYRKRHSNYPFLLIIIIIVALTEFFIYFTSSIGINIFIQPSFVNKYYFCIQKHVSPIRHFYGDGYG